jgi:hypothetical protein
MSSTFVELIIVILFSLVGLVIIVLFYFAYCRLTSCDPCDPDSLLRTSMSFENNDHWCCRGIDNCITCLDEYVCFYFSLRSCLTDPRRIRVTSSPNRDSSSKKVALMKMIDRDDDWDDSVPAGSSSSPSRSSAAAGSISPASKLKPSHLTRKALMTHSQLSNRTSTHHHHHHGYQVSQNHDVEANLHDVQVNLSTNNAFVIDDDDDEEEPIRRDDGDRGAIASSTHIRQHNDEEAQTRHDDEDDTSRFQASSN